MKVEYQLNGAKFHLVVVSPDTVRSFDRFLTKHRYILTQEQVAKRNHRNVFADKEIFNRFIDLRESTFYDELYLSLGLINNTIFYKHRLETFSDRINNVSTKILKMILNKDHVILVIDIISLPMSHSFFSAKINVYIYKG